MQFDLSRARDGILLIDKPAGWTSFDVCAKIRGQIKHTYRQRGEKPTKRQLRVGHAGTLDPFATGLLVILLGEATKKADEFLKLDKVYEATIELGKVSTTGDPEGELSLVSSREPKREEIEAVLKQFVGEIQQRPPIFSAIKVDGRRAYKLARSGQEVEIPLRTVHIHSLEMIEYAYPLLRVRTHVGSGTYIRSLAADIGKKLEVGAYCTELRRTGIRDFTVEQAETIAE